MENVIVMDPNGDESGLQGVNEDLDTTQVAILSQGRTQGGYSYSQCQRQSRYCYFLVRIFPIISWLPDYRWSCFVGDLIAGITVGLTVVPQSMAYAAIAGLSPEYGLYSSFIGCFVYIFLGSCKQITIGPTAIMSLLTFETCGANFPYCATLTAFYSGIIELSMALLRLGWVVNFISQPVTIGFTSAAALTICSSQIAPFLGLKGGGGGGGFLDYWKHIYENLYTTQLGDALVSSSSFLVLILFKELTRLNAKIFLLKKLLWTISISRNASVLLVTSLIAYLWPTSPPFNVIGTVVGGLPSPSLPHFSLPYNATTTVTQSPIQSFQFVITGALLIGIVGVLQNVAISKSFASSPSPSAGAAASSSIGTDGGQEMIALGTSNLLSSFFSSIPISGSFSRSAVNDASGVKSSASGLFSGLLVILSLLLISPSFSFIPKGSLAAVIISAVMSMVEWKGLFLMWRMDLLSCLLTFSISLIFGMEWGIGVGVAFDLLLLLLKHLSPSLQTSADDGGRYAVIKPKDLSFPSLNPLMCVVIECGAKYGIVILDMEEWEVPNYTTLWGIASMVDKVEKVGGGQLLFLNCSSKWVDGLARLGIESQVLHSLDSLENYVVSAGGRDQNRTNRTHGGPPGGSVAGVLQDEGKILADVDRPLL